MTFDWIKKKILIKWYSFRIGWEAQSIGMMPDGKSKEALKLHLHGMIGRLKELEGIDEELDDD